MNLQDSVPWFGDVLCNDRIGLVSAMKAAGIETRNFYLPVHSQPCYGTEENYPITQEIAELGLWLPSSVNLTRTDIAKICREITAYCRTSEILRPATVVSA